MKNYEELEQTIMDQQNLIRVQTNMINDQEESLQEAGRFNAALINSARRLTSDIDKLKRIVEKLALQRLNSESIPDKLVTDLTDNRDEFNDIMKGFQKGWDK